MPQLELNIEELAQHIFKKRRLEVFNPVYDKLFEDIEVAVKEQANDLALSEMKYHLIEFNNESERTELLIAVQQIITEELIKLLRIDLFDK